LRVTITGATGLIGRTLVARLRAAGAEVTVLSRDPERALKSLGGAEAPALQAFAWDPLNEPAPPESLAGRDAVVHMAGENVAQRWSSAAKTAIRESRVRGTANLIEGLRAVATETGPTASHVTPRVLVSSSAVGYYGPHGHEPIDEEARPGTDFLAEVCVAWEAGARAASELGLRTVQIRTGVVLDREGGALAKMLAPFRLGVGGPVAGGAQYMSWIHRDDLVGMMLAALEQESWSGPVNATAPEPVTNAEFSHELGRVLHRPSLLPVPGFALRALYGDMAEIVTGGARVLPAKALMLGYSFQHPRLAEALSDALG
jgi:uncharacterized protein (TIGR01777 family)